MNAPIHPPRWARPALCFASVIKGGRPFVRRLSDDDFRYVERGFAIFVAEIAVAPLATAILFGSDAAPVLIAIGSVAGTACLLTAGATIAHERHRRRRRKPGN